MPARPRTLVQCGRGGCRRRHAGGHAWNRRGWRRRSGRQRSVDFRDGAAVLGDTEAIALDPRTGFTILFFDETADAAVQAHVG